jgi:hypothetical protein
MSDISQEPDLGYIFYPYDAFEHPGHPRLDVIIQEKPTYRHFDPVKASFLVVSRMADKLEQISVRYPWTLGKSYRVCAGRIYLKDRAGNGVEAFSTGGDLQVVSDQDRTVAVLESSAPIFALRRTHDLPMWITSEIEIILARQKAHWDPLHPHEFVNHLATLDPLLLYASCLQAIQDKTDALFLQEDELDHQGEQFVRSEIQRLKENDQWPVILPTPDQLFTLEIKKQ